jgi:hypothetical protein
MGDIEDNKQVKEKKNINNKVKTSAMGGGIKLGEAVDEIGGTLLEMFEIGDAELTEEVDIATEYFYEQGLNEEGIDILIEELGLDRFIDFVFEISDEYTLVEARTLIGKKKNPQKLPKGTSPTTLTKAAVKKYGTTRKLASSDSPTIKKNRVAVKKAVAKQPETKTTPTQTKTGIAGRIGAALGAAVKRGREDIKRVQGAAQTAKDVATRRGAEAKAVYDAVRERGKKAEQSATATRARRKATVAAGKTVKAAAAAAGAGAGSLKAGKSPAAAAGRAAGTFVRKLNSGYEFEGDLVDEKMNLATANMGDVIKDFQTSDAPQFKGKTKEERRKMALAAKLEAERQANEELQPTTPQQFAAQRQLTMAQRKMTAADQAALKIKKKEVQQQEEFVSEEDYDRMKDERMMRGGVGGNINYRKSVKSGSSKPVDPEQRKKVAQIALELVRQQTMSKYGKKSLM